MKPFLDHNESLVRFSFVFNGTDKDLCFELIETCIGHPNLEIIQFAEKSIKRVKIKEKNEEKSDENKGKKDKKKDKEEDHHEHRFEKQSAISVARGIQVRLWQNSSLKILELRYLPLTRQILQALLKGLSKNKTLQKLVVANNSLKQATATEYNMLGDMLKVNEGLLWLDLSDNEGFDE